ncbi:MAG: MarR family winged helix-turn-helix transcriptional regulator [Gemmatimonadaceae bacterium]
MSSGPSSRPSASADRTPRADVVRTVDAIRSIIQTMRISGRAVEQELGISSAQLYVLQALAERPDQSINDLAYNTFTHQSSVSMVVTRLVAADLVRRSASRGDARRVSISLTPPGRALVRKAPRTAETRLIAGLQTFSRTELRQLADYLEAVAELAVEPVERES